MPLPYPEVFNANPKSLTQSDLKKLVVSVQIGVLNYLNLGRPPRAPSRCHRGGPLSLQQWEVVKRFECFLDAWFQLGTLSASDMGRTAGKVEDLERALQQLQQLSDASCSPQQGRSPELGRLHGTKVGTFKHVEADRLQFRGFPEFDPRPFLDAYSREIYEHPFDHAIDPEDFMGKIPRVRVHCTREERLKLYQLLDKSRRVKLFTSDQVRERFGSGVFAVLKSLEYDRLILDSRPHNLLENPPGRFIQTLGSGEALTHLHLEGGERLYISSNDIRDFYHLFHVSPDRCRRNCLVGTLSPREASTLQAFRPNLWNVEKIYVGLNCLAMGDTQAVEIAQTCHVGLCAQEGILDEEILIAMNLAPPRGKTGCGIVIDDFVSYSIDSREPSQVSASPTQASVLADQAEAAYKRENLIPHSDKAERDSLNAQVWGCTIDGEAGLVRGSLKRAAPLMKVITSVLEIGAITAGVLEIIVGSLISLFIFRRRLLSLLSEVFVCMKSRDRDEAFILGAELREELLLCAGLLPLAVVELRAEYSQEVYAVDASNYAEAAVGCKAGSVLAKELCRHGLRKGTWTKLLSPFAARERLHGTLDPEAELPGGSECTYKAHPLWVSLARSGKFKLVWKKKVNRIRHINIGELRSFLKTEKMAKIKGKPTRVAIGGDSQVALGCLLKGRSASPHLNQELQASVPHVLGGGIYSYFLYIPTSINPADGPSRCQDIPAPLDRPPKWWDLAMKGDFRELDKWLRSVEADPWALSGIPGLEEIRKSGPRELQAQLRGRKKATNSKLKQILRQPSKETIAAVDRRDQLAGGLRQPSLRGLKLQGSFIFPEGVDADTVLSKPGYIDLFSGSHGVALELARLTGRWVLTYDIKDSQVQNLLDPMVQEEVKMLIRDGSAIGVGAAPVCSSMSRAITPAWRTAALPHGLPGLLPHQQYKVDQGNMFASFVAEIAQLCIDLHVPFWIENPWASFLWYLPEFKRLRESQIVGFWLLDFCRFGTEWRKRTRVLTNTGLKGQKTLCLGCKKHLLLRGRCKRRRQLLTRLAEPYPKALCSTLAMALSGASGDRPEFRRLDGSACARCTHARIGEAKRPGPGKSTAAQRAAARAGVQLGSVELVGAKTAKLETKLWEGFLSWVREDCDDECAQLLTCSSATVAPLLQLYGDFLFKQGATLSDFRHLVAFALRKFPDFKVHAKVCWDFITRWELLEPLVHRLPLPWAACRAMASLALGWKWVRFALVLLIAFRGILRVGEVLKARRADLVLPSDLLSEKLDRMYLRIKDPKSKRRGGGKEQHTTIVDLDLVSACDRVFSKFDADTLLFPYSPHTFRRRWDDILKALGIQNDLGLTPGCIRGGAAVHAYQTGVPVQDLMWQMRIQHMATLHHYLQEMAAEAVLGKLSETTRRTVRVAASMLTPLLTTI